MARFTIFSPDGQEERYTGVPVYHGTFLKPAYLEFSKVASPSLVQWKIGDYVDYPRTGFRYRLYSIPQPTKQAVRLSNGDSFVYDNVQLFCATKDLEIAPFRDLVLNENNIHFTTLPDVSTYEDVPGIARRIQANLDSFYGGGAWNIRVYDTSDAEVRALLLETKEFSVSNGTCLDALSQIYSVWKGIGWVYSVENGVNTITIGRPNVQDSGNTTSVFAYGIGNGLKVVRKEQSSKNDFATRVYAYGSTRNMIARYYNNLTPAIKDAESVYIPNLMLPLAHWGETAGQKDARKAYVEAAPETLAKYGLRPKTIYFDGSDDYEEIYPSIAGVTTGNLRAAMSSTDDYYPDAAKYPLGTERVDEIVSAANPSDNGVVATDSGGKYYETFTLPGIGAVSKTQRIIRTMLPYFSIDLGALTTPTAITNGGKVRFVPNIQGTVTFPAGAIGNLSLNIRMEIDGEAYRSFSVPLDGTSTGAVASPIEIAMTIGNGGTATLYGEISGHTIAPADNYDVVVSLTVGNTTFNVEKVLSDTFVVNIRQVGFDISKQQTAVSGGLCTLSFRSGSCAGRDFTVKKVAYVQEIDGWALTVARQNDESIGQYFPNSIYSIEAGDRFVLLDLTMPEIYVTSAQERLYNRAIEVLTNLSKPKMVYDLDVDAKVLAQAPETILEGMYMPIMDPDIVEGTTEFVLIDGVEIDEASEAIPTYKITLQDEKREQAFSRITRESGRNTRVIREMEINSRRSPVDPAIPDYEVETKSSGGGGQAFFAAINDSGGTTIGAKALYDLHLIQGTDGEGNEVLKNFSEILRHLSLQVRNAGQPDEYSFILSDLSFVSNGNLVAGGIGGDTPGGGGGSIATLADVTLTNLSGGDILRYDATTLHWVNQQPALSMLSDVDLSGELTDGLALCYNVTTGKWEPRAGGAGPVAVTSDNATIGTSLTRIATVAGVEIKAQIASYLLAASYTGSGTSAVNRAASDASGNNLMTSYAASLSIANGNLRLMSMSGQQLSAISGANVVTYLIGNNAVARATADANGKTIASQEWVNDRGFLTSHQTVKLASGTNNGTLKLTTAAGTVDNIAVKGLGSLAFASSVAWSNISGKPDTIDGYGIRDAKIANGEIILGNSSITPLTSVSVSNKNATIGTALTTIATVQGTDIRAKIAAYLLASDFNASNIVATIATTPVKRATADGNGNVIADSYLRKNTDDTMAGNLTVGTASANKTLTLRGSTSAALNIYGGNNLTSIYREATYLQISSALRVSGNIVATGNVTAGAASDRRLKDNIRSITLTEAADLLSVLNPVVYRWNDKAAELGGLTGVARGFLADEYLDLIPNAGRKIWDEYDAIDYNQVIPYLVAGWQQQNLRLRIAESEIRTLKEDNQLLRRRLRGYGLQ